MTWVLLGVWVLLGWAFWVFVALVELLSMMEGHAGDVVLFYVVLSVAKVGRILVYGVVRGTLGMSKDGGREWRLA